MLGTGVGIPEGSKPTNVPIGRLAEAVEVAQLVLFLASEDASYLLHAANAATSASGMDLVCD